MTKVLMVMILTVIIGSNVMFIPLCVTTAYASGDSQKSLKAIKAAAVLQYLAASARSDNEGMRSALSPSYISHNVGNMKWIPNSFPNTEDIKIISVTNSTVVAEVIGYDQKGKIGFHHRLTFRVEFEDGSGSVIIPDHSKEIAGTTFVYPWASDVDLMQARK